ncbi:hypothetical protein [Paraburkholderia sp. 40]|uniref:hypothetical protein n=1 Tax=Paraburkholderia sp. 40 TaxID=2991059 RepID=UPI003D2148F0
MLINEGFQDCVRQSSSAWKKSAFASFRISLGAQLLELAEIERELAIEVSCERSSLLNTSCAFDRPNDMTASPVPVMPSCYAHVAELTMGRNTSSGARRASPRSPRSSDRLVTLD